MILPNVLLLVTIMSLVWFLRGDLLGYRRIKRLPDTASRQKTYRLWIAKAAIAFVLPAVIGLALLGRLDALVTVPPDDEPGPRLRHAQPRAQLAWRMT